MSQQKVSLNKKLHNFHTINKNIIAIEDIIELFSLEADDDFLNEGSEIIQSTQSLLAKLEFQSIFRQEHDINNAFIEIQSGSGGTEAQDWAEMLLRMYLKWLDKKEFHVEILDIANGEVAGVKNATIKVKGEYAYGWLKTENGIHRLVRKSPFNANNKRHTSFASIFILPEIDENIEIAINNADLKIDTYRASGAGGQHVNKTDSAIRITHIPSGIVVQCQADRSQHKNRAQAMQQLKAKLYEKAQNEKKAEQSKIEEGKSDISWGTQIRSYVLDDSRVKDLRTGYETSNTQAVLDGNLDQFVTKTLQYEANKTENE